MATLKKTYKSSDWKFWMYQPVAGKFRLDFSKLDGTDVLGDTADTGALSIQSVRMSHIEIISDSTPIQNGFTNHQGTTATIIIEDDSFTKTSLLEYYPGKRIGISYPDYSGADVYWFNGSITDVSIDVDVSNGVATITLNASDDFQTLLNTMLTISKNTVSNKVDLFNAALADAQTVPGYLPDTFNSAYISAPGITKFESAGRVTRSIGDWLDDISFSDNLVIGVLTTVKPVSVGELTLDLWSSTISGLKTPSIVYTEIPENKIYNANIGIRGADKATAFTVTTPSGITVSYGDSLSNQLNGAVLLTRDCDATTADILQAIQAYVQFKPTLEILSLDVVNAYNNGPIEFEPAVLTYPANILFYTKTALYSVTKLGYSAEKAFVTGSTHNITPDSWTTTYNLYKWKVI